MPNPQTDNNPTAVTNRATPSGTHIGLEMMMIGVNRIRPITMPVTVRPVRRTKMPPETRRLRKPRSWAEFGAFSWSFWRKAPPGVAAGAAAGGLGALWTWAGLE